MNTRREFVKLAAGAGVLTAAGTTKIVRASVGSGREQSCIRPGLDRALWCEFAGRLAKPVFRTVGQMRGDDLSFDIRSEAVSRLLSGIAPWLEQEGTHRSAEGSELCELARAAFSAHLEAAGNDSAVSPQDTRALVDWGFFSLALLRAPNQLWSSLQSDARRNLISLLRATRVVEAREDYQMLCASVIELALQRVGERRLDGRLYAGVRRFLMWPHDDGSGCDPTFHWGGRHSFVIQPMLDAASDILGEAEHTWATFRTQVRVHTARLAATEERLIAPDGTYPLVGSAATSGCGIFQNLAMTVRRGSLPPELKPGRVRTALTTVIRRTLATPGTFDSHGWLQPHFPRAASASGISSAALYLQSEILQPLGLPPNDPFWVEPALDCAWKQAWSDIDPTHGEAV